MRFSEWAYREYFFERKIVGALVGTEHSEFYAHSSGKDDLVLRDLSHELMSVTRLSEIQFKELDVIPTLSFSHTAGEIAISKGFPEELIINHPSLIAGTKKKKMHEKLDGTPWVPKTVFTQEDALKLKFPVIAKASESQAAKGVYQFKTPDEMDSEMKKLSKLGPQEKPDLFCEKIDISQEFRAVMYKNRKGEIFLVYTAERIPLEDGKIKSLREEDMHKDLDWLENKDSGLFSWKLLSLYSDVPKGAYEIFSKCFDVNPRIQIMAVDFCIDSAGKYWYIECNTHPRMSYFLPISLYYQAVKDFYGEGYFEHGSPGMSKLVSLAKKHVNYTSKIHPTYQVPEFEFEYEIGGVKIN